MAFEPVFELTKLDSLKRICSSQAVVEARLLPSSGAAIARVLSIATDYSVSAGEVFTGEARYSGRVTFKMIYVDAEGNNHSMDYNADFTDKLSDDQIAQGQKVVVRANILDTDIVSVDEREIKLACVLEVFLDAVVTDSVNILTRGGQNIYTHEDKIEYTRLVSEGTNTFGVTDTLSDIKCTDVLLAEPKIIITKTRSGLNSATVEGRIICDIACETADGMIEGHSHVTMFSQEMPLSDANENSSVLANAIIKNYKVVLETDGEKGAVNFDYEIEISAKAFSDEVCETIVDAFSVTNELLVAGESLKIYKNIPLATIFDRVDGAVTLDINMPLADNILAVTGSKVNIASAIGSSGKITFEGVVSCNVIYYSAEANTKSSVAVEMPFSFTSNANVSEGDEITARGIVTKVMSKIRRGNEIDIKTEIEIEISASRTETKYVITELALGEERALPTSAFSIHISKAGETLWDVAKALGTTPEIVLTQNPKLTLPLAGGERVIAYRNLK